MSRIKLGVAFAGGGVRGSGHLGIMQALYEHDIYPEIYVGTSAGSIVASLLAYGYKPKDALVKFEELNKDLIDIAYSHIVKGLLTKSYAEGFVAGNVLEELLDRMFEGSTMEKIHSPLAIITTEINLGRQIIFTNKSVDHKRINDDSFIVINNSSEPLSSIVRASSGMPPIFVPKNIHNLKLVDGGITNNLPSDIAWALGSNKVISLDLGYAGEVETKGFIDIAHMSVNLLMERVTDGNRKDFGLYLNPSIYDVTALDTSRIEECFDRGYAYGLSHIEDVVKMLEEN